MPLLRLFLLLLLLLSFLAAAASDGGNGTAGCPWGRPGLLRGRAPSRGEGAGLAQARAHLAPDVFLGGLRSVLVQRDGTVRAWFAVERHLKRSGAGAAAANPQPDHFQSLPAVRPRWAPTPAWRKRRRRRSRPADTEVVYESRAVGGACAVEVEHSELSLGARYLVFGVPWRAEPWPSMLASAPPLRADERTLRAVRRTLCTGCAVPPSVTKVRVLSSEPGRKGRLRCEVGGTPIPWIEWYKDGRRIQTGGRVRVKTRRRASRLVIRLLRPSDAGEYQCRARNELQEGPAAATLTLRVPGREEETAPPQPTGTGLWRTEPCQVTHFCLNGGTCVFYRDVHEYVCHCADGFVGLRCDYKDVRVSLQEVRNYSPRSSIP